MAPPFPPLPPLPVPEQLDIVDLLTQTVARGASDLHLCAGSPPMVRVHGNLEPLSSNVLKPERCRDLIYSIFTENQRARFEEMWELDFAVVVEGQGRFRGNAHYSRSTVEATFRHIPGETPPLASLGLPPVVRELCALEQGLIIITGITGSGKTTTLAAMVEEINNTRSGVIISIEDPIEYIFKHKLCRIKQREIGTDTKSFPVALRHVLRQDPDVILISEMRDLETMSAAITAAETGHLVLATLHTSSAPQTIDRIIDVFPAHQQAQIRTQLSESLQGVIAQSLLPRVGGGRVVALEILVTTAAVRNLIREGKTFQLPSVIETGSAAGMISLAQSLQALVQANKITRDTALAAGIERDLLDGPRLMSQASAKAYMTSAPTKEMPESDPDLADLHPINAAA